MKTANVFVLSSFFLGPLVRAEPLNKRAACTPAAASIATSLLPAYAAQTSSSPTYIAITSIQTPIAAAPIAETPTPTYTPVVSSLAVAAVTAASSVPANHYFGDITYYNPAGGRGSCGWTIQDTDLTVALAHGMMGEQSNGNPWCSKKITILHDGVTHTATIGDKCGGCDGESIDLTAGLWAIVAPDVDGRAHNVEWWVNE